MGRSEGDRPTPTMGDVLRDARYRRNVSLEEVEDQTHVRKKYLMALEDDDYAQLPAPVYARGFLEIYAEFLGIDPNFASKLYQPPGRTPPAEPLRPVSAFNEGSGFPLHALGVVALVALGIAAVFYLYAQYLEFSATSDEVVVTSRPTPVPPTATSLVVVALPTPTPTALPSPSPTPVRSVEVVVLATERTWLRVIADGQSTPLFEGELKAGDTRTWTARDKIDMRVGNAGGVEVTVNGLRQGKLGASGEVKNVTWGRQ